MVFSNLFGKKSKKDESSLIEQINNSMNNLVAKAENLNDNYVQEKQVLAQIHGLTMQFKHSDDIRSAKFETEILCRITACSFAMENAISGSDEKMVGKSLNELANYVNQRMGMQ